MRGVGVAGELDRHGPSYPISASALEAAATSSSPVAEHQVLVHAAAHVLDVDVDEPVGAAAHARLDGLGLEADAVAEVEREAERVRVRRAAGPSVS